jgi:predicted nucleic acid-binding protein
MTLSLIEKKQTAGKAFFDTNVLLYALTIGVKAEAAYEIMGTGGYISVQVLNEFVNVARKKYKLPFETIEAMLNVLRETLIVCPVTLDVHEAAIVIAARTGYTIYDSSILAAARIAGCDVVYSEDMQHGQAVMGVTIVNPFL